MTINDVVEIANLYAEISYHPINSEVRFGCDCGCGGDSYTEDEWDKESADLVEMKKELDVVCDKFNIELY